MTLANLISHPAVAVAMALAGLAVGLAYFTALRRGVALMVGGKGWLAPLALTLARLGAAAGFLFFAAQQGAVPLLAALAGFLAARALMLRPHRRAD